MFRAGPNENNPHKEDSYPDSNEHEDSQHLSGICGFRLFSCSV